MNNSIKIDLTNKNIKQALKFVQSACATGNDFPILKTLNVIDGRIEAMNEVYLSAVKLTLLDVEGNPIPDGLYIIESIGKDFAYLLPFDNDTEKEFPASSRFIPDYSINPIEFQIAVDKNKLLSAIQNNSDYIVFTFTDTTRPIEIQGIINDIPTYTIIMPVNIGQLNTRNWRLTNE